MRLTVSLTAWHLGALHPVEQLLTVFLAFAPFVVLGVVIAVRRRQDALEPDQANAPDRDPEHEAQRDK